MGPILIQIVGSDGEVWFTSDRHFDFLSALASLGPMVRDGRLTPEDSITIGARCYFVAGKRLHRDLEAEAA